VVGRGESNSSVADGEHRGRIVREYWAAIADVARRRHSRKFHQRTGPRGRGQNDGDISGRQRQRRRLCVGYGYLRHSLGAQTAWVSHREGDSMSAE